MLTEFVRVLDNPPTTYTIKTTLKTTLFSSSITILRIKIHNTSNIKKFSFARLFRALLVSIVRFGIEGKEYILLEVKLVLYQN